MDKNKEENLKATQRTAARGLLGSFYLAPGLLLLGLLALLAGLINSSHLTISSHLTMVEVGQISFLFTVTYLCALGLFFLLETTPIKDIKSVFHRLSNA